MSDFEKMLAVATFRKSSFSGHGDCVEITQVDDWTGIRDSKNPNGPVLWFTKTEWDAFAHGVITGEFGGETRAIRWISALARIILQTVF
ncbi:DUF397 domain-containing protein [Nocardia beijingensis]|uniref:DUF397 domain-containing protein n=1 Tax=Nocardia beijingensis TaxID=95162 RepID=UPI001894AC8D|nr:DUF397 domain-containing protein [Nocardia beijingensis]MBF6469957.1 DUF397 domain-containing protein [Nocardia beijingensis]